MAINNEYYAQVKVKGVSDKLQEAKQFISSGDTGAIITNNKDKIKEKIKTLQTQEELFFDAVNIPKGTVENRIKVFRQRIDKCKSDYNTILSRLTGSGAREASAALEQQADNFSQNTEEMRNILSQIVEKNPKIQEIKNEKIESVVYNALEILTADIEKNGYKEKRNAGKVGKLKKTYENKTIETITFNELTAEAKRRVLYALSYEQEKENATVKKHTKSAKKSADSLTIKAQSKEDALVFYMTYDDYIWGENKPQKEQQEKDKIIAFIKNHVGTTNDIFNLCCEEIIQDNDIKNFFYGGNYKNNIVGLLGEIMGLYYMKVILNVSPKSTIKWQGDLMIDSKKPHEDLVLIDNIKRAYGIQIKNTTFDDVFSKNRGSSGYIHFANGNFLNFMNKYIYSNNIIDLPPIDAFKEIYTMYAFNVVYEADPGKFKGLRNAIEVYAERAEKMIALCIDSLMFIQLQSNSNLNGNIVYFIGGSSIVMASEVLMSIYEELEKIETKNKRVKISSSFKSKDGDIGTYTGYRRYIKDKGKDDISSNNEIAGSLKMTSSFLFTDDLKEIYMRNKN